MSSIVKSQFQIELPNHKAASYRLVSIIIALLNIAGFAAFFFRETNSSKQMLVAIGAIISIIGFAIYFTKIKTGVLSFFGIEVLFLVDAIIWFIYGNIWLALFLMVVAVFAYYSSKKTAVQFNVEGIIYPSFPQKHFKWADVDFAMMKDGILTIELTNNHIYQFTLDTKVADAINEEAFNHFCKNQKRQSLK